MAVSAQLHRRQRQQSAIAASPHHAGNRNDSRWYISRIRPLEYGNQALQRQLRSQGFQTRPLLSRPQDRYEREADRTADEIMRTPDESFPDTRADGQPLSASSRAFFEALFDRDFSGVRLHSGPAAAAAAQAVDAKAFTVGRDIVFGAGCFAPQTSEGRRLMAHELAHVVQQTESGMEGAGRLQRTKNDTAPDEPSLQSQVNALVDELYILKKKNAWSGINEKYELLEDLGEVAFDYLSASRSTAEAASIHDLGAAAAMAVGNMQQYWERTQRQKNVLAADVGHIDDATLKQVLEGLSNVHNQFGAVRIAPRTQPKSERKRARLRGPELVQVQGPSSFDPVFPRSVVFAAEEIKSTGFFEGLIPAGAYRLGDQEFTVTAGTKTTDQNVLTVLWGA
jgi:hypothetical protein